MYNIMNKTVLFIIIIAVLCIPLVHIQESFTGQLRSCKHKTQRHIRRFVRDGFTQIKSIFH